MHSVAQPDKVRNMKSPLDSYLTTRLTVEQRKQFVSKAERFGKPSEVLRDIIVAFIENRLIVTQPTKVKEVLYVTRSQD